MNKSVYGSFGEGEMMIINISKQQPLSWWKSFIWGQVGVQFGLEFTCSLPAGGAMGPRNVI